MGGTGRALRLAGKSFAAGAKCSQCALSTAAQTDAVRAAGGIRGQGQRAAAGTTGSGGVCDVERAEATGTNAGTAVIRHSKVTAGTDAADVKSSSAGIGQCNSLSGTGAGDVLGGEGKRSREAVDERCFLETRCDCLGSIHGYAAGSRRATASASTAPGNQINGRSGAEGDHIADVITTTA